MTVLPIDRGTCSHTFPQSFRSLCLAIKRVLNFTPERFGFDSQRVTGVRTKGFIIVFLAVTIRQGTKVASIDIC